jgi:hypothetical protein
MFRYMVMAPNIGVKREKKDKREVFLGLPLPLFSFDPAA